MNQRLAEIVVRRLRPLEGRHRRLEEVSSMVLVGFATLALRRRHHG